MVPIAVRGAVRAGALSALADRGAPGERRVAVNCARPPKRVFIAGATSAGDKGIDVSQREAGTVSRSCRR